jgi:hypothetical protein
MEEHNAERILLCIAKEHNQKKKDLNQGLTTNHQHKKMMM